MYFTKNSRDFSICKQKTGNFSLKGNFIGKIFLFFLQNIVSGLYFPNRQAMNKIHFFCIPRLHLLKKGCILCNL